MLDITKDNFNKAVLESKVTVLVDVWSPTCAPCKGMEPAVEYVQAGMGDSLTIVKLNAVENPDLCEYLEITGLPTFIVYKDGVRLADKSGSMTKMDLINLITGAIANR